jgi:hypothetical protein
LGLREAISEIDMKVYVAYQQFAYDDTFEEGIAKVFDSEEKAIAWINDAPNNYIREYEELEVE